MEMKDNQYYGTGLLKSNGIIRMNFKFEPKKSEHRVSVFDEQGQIIFDGFERNNLKTGECVDYVNGNIVFIGTYQNGMRNGYGTSFDENGNVLNAGRWKNNIFMMEDQEMKYSSYADLDMYELNYYHSKAVFPTSITCIILSTCLVLISIILMVIFLHQNIARNGHLVLSDGRIWEGKVKKNLPNGYGIFSYSNHSIFYKGNCEDGFFNGNGTFYTSNTTYYKGEWEYDSLNKGEFYCNENDGLLCYSGSFLNLIPHGVGKSYDKNHSVVFEGIWQYGSPYHGKYFNHSSNPSYSVVFEGRTQEFDSTISIVSFSDFETKCSFTTTRVIVPRNSYNGEGDVIFSIPANCSNVEEIYVGENCGKFVVQFSLWNLTKLKRVIIQSNSFTSITSITSTLSSEFSESSESPESPESFELFSETPSETPLETPLETPSQSLLSLIMEEERSFSISHCEKLEFLHISSTSFSNFYHFQLTRTLYHPSITSRPSLTANRDYWNKFTVCSFFTFI